MKTHQNCTPYRYSDWSAGLSPPKGWDCADAYEDGWTRENLEAFMRATVRPFAEVYPRGKPSVASPKAEHHRLPANNLPSLKPSPFTFRDPSTIPPRQWLYGHHLIRAYVSATIAPGGVGKSTVVIAEALAMATGRPLLGVRPHDTLRVWIWNGEDPRDELERRVQAVMLRHDVPADKVEGNLWLDSGRDMPIKISRDGHEIDKPAINALVATIREHKIDVVIIDPFVSVHSLPENDNGAMDAAVKALAQVAHLTGCAIDLVHHSRKLNGVDADIDSARGGSAIAGAVRSARVLNVMSGEAATGFGIAEADRRSFVRIDDAKANLAPTGKARWVKLSGEPLGNGTIDKPQDFVAVAEAWTPPDAMDGISVADLLKVQQAIDGKDFRKDVQAADWVGYAVAQTLGLNADNPMDKHKIKAMLKAWFASSALVVVNKPVRGGKRDAPVVEVGEWASSAPP